MSIKKVALWVDSGWYTEGAVRLAQDFQTVLYWCPWQKDFPTMIDTQVGVGLENVIRIKDLYWGVEEADVIVFPDLYYADFQSHLRRAGYRVWGTGDVETYETDRLAFKSWLEAHSLPVIPYRTILGMDELRRFMQSEPEEGWIKLARGMRGDTETHHFVNWPMSESWFYRVRHKVGPAAERIVFLYEPSIEGFEGGADAFSIDGQFPKTAVQGYEIKDQCYVAHIKPWDSIPIKIRRSMEQLAGLFKELGYRNLFSTEVRITPEGTPYFLDLCARFPSPPFSSMIENIRNFGEIIWYGSEGVLVEPEWEAPYAVEINLENAIVSDNWLPLEIDPDLRRWIKIHRVLRLENQYYAAPFSGKGVQVLGHVVGLGQTLQAARNAALAHCEGIHGEEIMYDTSALEKAEKEIEEGNAHGLPF